MDMRLVAADPLVIKNKKLLLAYSINKKCFYLPGGKIDVDETAATALCREIEEEMKVTIGQDELRFYTHITAPAYGELNGTIMEQDCFFLHRDIMPQPSSEIGELKYFSRSDYLSETNRAAGAVIILEKLKHEGLID